MQAISRFNFTPFQSTTLRRISQPSTISLSPGADTVHFGRHTAAGDNAVTKILDSYLSKQEELERQSPEQQIASLQKYATILAKSIKGPLSHQMTEMALLLANHLISRIFLLQNNAKLKEMDFQEPFSISALKRQIDAFSAISKPTARKMAYRTMSATQKFARLFGMIDIAEVKAGKLDAGTYNPSGTG